MELQELVRRIKNLEIQGAEAVARESIRFLLDMERSGASHDEMHRAAKALRNARPTEPFLRNCIRVGLKGGFSPVLEQISSSREEIARYGSRKIRDGYIVYTHCHSSTVIRVLEEAKKLGKGFEVRVTETRPLYQGRRTARELSELGIPVTLYVDSAAGLALQEADIMMIGSDAITSEGKVINKIGSRSFAYIAKSLGVPVYICTNSWKFDPETIFGFEEPIEERAPEEVWENPPAGVTVRNPAFEIIEPELVEAIITEIGIYRPDVLPEAVKERYPEMFG